MSVPAYLIPLERSSGVEIVFGKGRHIVAVLGTSKGDVDRVVRSLLGQIAD